MNRSTQVTQKKNGEILYDISCAVFGFLFFFGIILERLFGITESSLPFIFKISYGSLLFLSFLYITFYYLKNKCENRLVGILIVMVILLFLFSVVFVMIYQTVNH